MLRVRRLIGLESKTYFVSSSKTLEIIVFSRDKKTLEGSTNPGPLVMSPLLEPASVEISSSRVSFRCKRVSVV
jgi:hypothetical protein